MNIKLEHNIFLGHNYFTDELENDTRFQKRYKSRNKQKRQLKFKFKN